MSPILITCRIWLLDLAESLPPTVQLDGFDISLAQAPSTKWLPSNVTLREWDMFTEPPAELVGLYDIVHIRLVTLVVKDNNALPIIQNIRKLLSTILTMLRMHLNGNINIAA